MNVEDPLHEYGRWCKSLLEDGETGKQYETALEVMDLLNEFNDENEQLKSENDSYKNIFFEIVETALTDTNCKKLYCKGILDIFDKANSLNQAREMIKEHLE